MTKQKAPLSLTVSQAKKLAQAHYTIGHIYESLIEKSEKKNLVDVDKKKLKRPLTPYISWGQVAREEIKRQHPEYTQQQISKELGQRWKDIDPKVKADFEKKYEKERLKYQKELSKLRELGEQVIEHPLVAESEEESVESAPLAAPATQVPIQSHPILSQANSEPVTFSSPEPVKRGRKKKVVASSPLESPKTPSKKDKKAEKAAETTDKSEKRKKRKSNSSLA